MKRYTLYNIGRILTFVCMLLLADVGIAWGQTYTINTQSGKTFPQENVPELVDTIYIENDEERTLTIPELNEFGASSWASEYKWYVRWYRMNEAGEVQTITDYLKAPTGSVLLTTNNQQSLFGHNGFGYYNGAYIGPNAMANVIYTGDGRDDIVFCDLSVNIDGLGLLFDSGTTSKLPENITEPTISKRYRFIIKNADDMSARLSAISEDQAMETCYITIPDNANNVNLQLPMNANNYYWQTNDQNIQGTQFSYRINNGSYRNINAGSRVISITQQLSSGTTVDVIARSSDDNRSPIITKYIITKQSNSGFVLEDDIEEDDEYRNPEKFPDKFAEIGFYDFDTIRIGDEIKEQPKSTLSVENNISKTPMPSEETSYGFTDPTLNTISGYLTPKRDHYGLYRSANVNDISDRNITPNIDSWGQGTMWSQNSGYAWGATLGARSYDWFFPRVFDEASLYDRTHETKSDQPYGFFFYVDASVQPGRIVNVPINGTICGGTELTVIVWVADLTDRNNGSSRTKPNLNLLLRGVNNETGGEEILHRYSTGDALEGLGQWQQICYRVTIDQATANKYSNYTVEVQNNATDSDGADYAIDDIRIYKSLPNISVQRKDACDASTLYVSSDYETILRNMGWEKDQDVLQIEELSNVNYRKYRYGLMGDDPYADIKDIGHTNIGNVYFSFAYINSESTGTNADDWVTIKKDIENEPDLVRLGLHKTMRVFVPTNLKDETLSVEEQVPVGYSDLVTRYEIVMNVRAMNDFIADTRRGPNDSTDPNEYYWKDEDLADFGFREITTFNAFRNYVYSQLCKVDQNGVIQEVYWENIMNNVDGVGDTYELCVKAMYEFLAIPRIHCPWTDVTKTNIYLSTIDVANTDLRYRGEQRPGETQPSDGKYWVVLFSAREVAGGSGGAINLQDPCTLISEFTVEPATTILIQTETNTNTATCAGSLRKVNAVLNGYDTDGEPVDLNENNIYYLFDWYLGSEEEYEADAIQYNNIPLKTDLEAYRDATTETGVITIADLNTWDGYDNNGHYVSGADRIKTRLIKLLTEDENGFVLLKSGAAGSQIYDLFITGTEIIAMPYVYSNNSSGSYTYCTDKTAVQFDISEAENPTVYTGFEGVEYPFSGSAPLRLGQQHLTQITIPVNTEKLSMAQGATSIGTVPSSTTKVLLKTEDTTLPEIGEVVTFSINKDATKADFTIKWNNDATEKMREGQSYDLLIPFVQFDENGVLSAACDGLVSLTVKIVPEYLTWKGSDTDVWYKDGNWNQSTKGEIYIDPNGTSTEDANGTDNIENAFSPLYFTKITIPEEKQLSLSKETGETLNLSGDKVTPNIQYDMAVNTDANGAVKIVPYYGNKVSEIYFKPNATLMNQHYLTYDTARVEFEMKNNTPYWKSSPLHDVYAGDMYAPTANGRQETEAFKHISYDEALNSRWNPAFYQKAWNKAVAYSTVENPYVEPLEAGAVVDVDAVKSNWSIEYNDVWVPYSLGKGFYARVEEKDVLVRLPKADLDYGYEENTVTTRSGLSPKPTKRENAGRMAGNETITVTLDKEVDGDGNHFLVGNPYMTYLDMKAFFDANTSLNRKYWTLNGQEVTAVVGTPDVAWTGNETEGKDEAISGYIPPMTAFFVERAGYTETTTRADGESGTDGETTETTPTTITFTPSMMASKADATAASTATTRSVSASNPVITLTAERNGKIGRSVVALRDNADNGYKASEDAVVLLDSELDAPMAYTVSGSKAAQVNAVKTIQNVGLGVYNEKGGEVTLTIEGLSELANPLYLYDAQTRKSTLLEGDSYSLQVSGESHGRYFLRDKALASELENTISIYSARRGQVIVSALQPVKEIKVFGLNGALVKQFAVNTTQYMFDLPAGIYMIYANDGTQEHTEKVIVK